MAKFTVRYARVVIMETEVEADCEDDVKDEGLPSVYGEEIPDHVEEVVDYEEIWEVTPADEDEPADEDDAEAVS